MTILRLSVIHLSLLVLIVQATQFSHFNRYEFSYTTADSLRAAIRDNNPNAWYSIHTSAEESEAFPLKKTINGQTFGAGFSMLGGFEYASKPNRFGAIQTEIDYTSSFLSAHISADIYSTERQTKSIPDDIQFERFIKSNFNKPIEGMFDFRANLPEAYLRATYKSFTLTTGKQRLRWGPGYKGTLGLSGTNYSPFYFYDLNFEFDNLFHAQSFLCGYDDEVKYRGEFTTNEKIIVKASNREIKTYLPRYGAGQRVDMRIGKHLQLGVYELVDFFGTNELNRFANPLQMYYLANEASGTNNANLLAGIDFNLMFKPFRFYGEFINDDITIFEKTGNPDKYAFQLGGAYYGVDPLVAAGIEFSHLSKYIYGHSRVLSRHAHWGESMGWPWGNYMDVVTAYAVFKLPKDINGRVEANYWLRGEGAITDEWYADGKPDLDNAPFFPEHAKKIYSMIISAEYKPFPWLTYAFYYEPIVQHKELRSEFYTYLQCRIPDFIKNKFQKQDY